MVIRFKLKHKDIEGAVELEVEGLSGEDVKLIIDKIKIKDGEIEKFGESLKECVEKIVKEVQRKREIDGV